MLGAIEIAPKSGLYDLIADPGETSLAYLGGVGVYRKTCDAIRDNAYEGFVLRTQTSVLPGREAWSGASDAG